MRQVLRSPLFDHQYYGLQSSTQFPSRRHAARHLLRYAADRVCHPLVEKAWIEAMAPRSTTSPLFAVEDEDPMGALERFLASATDSDPLRPITGPNRTATWGEA